MDRSSEPLTTSGNGRSTGVLLHPTALPGSPVCGSFGEPSRSWLHLLAENNIGVWQMLPLAPPDPTGSPYSSPSCFALNPWLLDAADLTAEGFISGNDQGTLPGADAASEGVDRVDFALANQRSQALATALLSRWPSQSQERHEAFRSWCDAQAWLEDHARYSVLHDQHQGAWWSWPAPLATHREGALQRWSDDHGEALLQVKLVQWHLDRQWQAILTLAEEGLLEGTSLLVNGPVATEGAKAWSVLAADRPTLQLCLHLCLTEGPSSAPPDLIPDLVDQQGHLHRSFGHWLLLSLLPPRHPRRARLVEQLGLEIEAQVRQFQAMRGEGPIALDGHQHIHLVPVVLDAVLARSSRFGITWLRSTDEPLPTGLPLRYWWQACRDAGLIKWLVLQLLSRRARGAFRQHGITSNGGFAGVLFTGRMTGAPLRAAWSELASLGSPDHFTPSLLLAHPGAPLEQNLVQEGFTVSQPFAASPWRQREWRALQALSVTPDECSG